MPSDSPDDTTPDDERTEETTDRFIESESRPAHADTSDENDAERPADADHVSTDVDELPEEAQRELHAQADENQSVGSDDDEQIVYDARDNMPSEEFIKNLPEEDQQKFRDQLASDDDAEQSGGEETDTDDVETTADTPDTVDAPDPDASDKKVSQAKERVLAKADQIREENADDSGSDDPLSKYENQDFSDFEETPDSWEYEVDGRYFLMVPPEARDDDADIDTSTQRELQRAQDAMQRAEEGEDLSDEDEESIRTMQRTVVQNIVYAPTITNEMWESWSDTYQRRVFSAAAHFLNEEVAGFTRKRKNGQIPAKRR